MVKEYSPFTPGVPVPLEFFIGRTQEIQKFISSIKKSIEVKTIERIFVMGERGIGKSSICNMAIRLAEHELNVLGVRVLLGGIQTLEETTRRIFDGLLKSSFDRPWYESLKTLFGKHIRQVGLLGVTLEFAATDEDLAATVRNFVPALRNFFNQIKNQKGGLVLVLDDINGLASSAHFANWLKSIIDEAATAPEPIPLTLVLVGLAERYGQLVERQPSLNRVFDVLQIERFSEEETREFFKKTFERAGVSVSDQALGILNHYSGGHPALMHEIGDVVFKMDSDNFINEADATNGVFKAAEVIGVKYIEPKISAALRSQKYRSILKKLSRPPFRHEFARKDVASKLSPEETKVFDNFLHRMEALGVIRKELDGGPGKYDFTERIYYLYFQLAALQQNSTKK